MTTDGFEFLQAPLGVAGIDASIRVPISGSRGGHRHDAGLAAEFRQRLRRHDVSAHASAAADLARRVDPWLLGRSSALAHGAASTFRWREGAGTGTRVTVRVCVHALHVLIEPASAALRRALEPALPAWSASLSARLLRPVNLRLGGVCAFHPECEP